MRKTEKGKYSMEVRFAAVHRVAHEPDIASLDQQSNLLIRTHAAMEHLGFEV